MFIEALFIIAQIWKQPQSVPTVEVINKLWHYSSNVDTATEKNKPPYTITQMNRTNVTLSKKAQHVRTMWFTYIKKKVYLDPLPIFPLSYFLFWFVCFFVFCWSCCFLGFAVELCKFFVDLEY